MERQIGSSQFILGQIIYKKTYPMSKNELLIKQLTHFILPTNIRIIFKLQFLHSYWILLEILANLCQIGLLSVRLRVKVRHFFSWCKADNQKFRSLKTCRSFVKKRFNCLGFTNSINRGFLHTLSRGIRWMFWH